MQINIYLSRQLTHKISFEFLAIFQSLSSFDKTRFWQHISGVPTSCQNRGLTVHIYIYIKDIFSIIRLNLFLKSR
jgi:hypothetical protein